MDRNGSSATTEDGEGVGIHPGFQGGLHLSIAADPSNPGLVYIGGDRQPGPFPNSLGAQTYSGRLFRGDATATPGSQWTPLTNSGTATNSSPHADSREMVFDAIGNLIETDDAGVYRRTTPNSSSGDWFSLNGDLQTTEYHGVAYDTVSNIVIGGAQDTGTTEQVIPGVPTFFSVLTGDGGDVVVDDVSTPGLSTRFSSHQNLILFNRRVYDHSNVLQSMVIPQLEVIGGGDPFQFGFTRRSQSTKLTATV